jgi:hypothetical protein
LFKPKLLIFAFLLFACFSCQEDEFAGFYDAPFIVDIQQLSPTEVDIIVNYGDELDEVDYIGLQVSAGNSNPGPRFEAVDPNSELHTFSLSGDFQDLEYRARPVIRRNGKYQFGKYLYFRIQ